MKTLKFTNGDMPILGLGTWKSAPGDVYNAVKEALKLGYRHIDCAAVYGNESEVGKAISESISEGVVTREELWVTSKLWNNMHGKSNVVTAIKQTLSDLQLDYLDLYLIHWPVPFKKEVPAASKPEDFVSLEDQPIADTWLGMEEAFALGLSKSIGVSNFSIKKLKDLIGNCKIKPCLNQVELHPYFQQDDLVDYCQSVDVHVMAYSPLGSSDRPQGLKTADEPVLLEDIKLTELAKEKGVSIAQLILAWAMQRSISVIPKSVNPARLKQNLDSADLSLTEHEMAQVKAVNKNRRYVNGSFFAIEGSPVTLENLWDL
ncbi:aldo/keto reductase [Saccharicrinis aurantiacus]|uniref:aldo/keto reductase n=1 Tax=Saccharicrinis aurantiacus TaxID=1849719 RepID=UPI0024924885|nr:aldo/keto reductase [Saccharicrinis aurantiacus]